MLNYKKKEVFGKKNSNLYLTHAIKSALDEWQRFRVQIDVFLFKGRIKYNRGRFKIGDHKYKQKV